MNQAVHYPALTSLQHIAIIMDGNNRYAKKHGLKQGEGHLAGKRQLDEIVQHAYKKNIPIVTVFAFSSENWNRPVDEVQQLMQLLDEAIDDQIARMVENQVCMRFIGDRSRLSLATQEKMAHAEQQTAIFNERFLNIAISYGGQWDILQAANRAIHDAIDQDVIDRNGVLKPLTAEQFEKYTALGDFPPVDLLIRTGGEYRISNFLLWQLAYAELFFSPLLWPEFTTDAFDQAVRFFYERERRFGQTHEQVSASLVTLNAK